MLKKLFCLVLAAVAALGVLAGCSPGEQESVPGTLTVEDMTVAVGESAAVKATFTGCDPLPIEYLFDGNDILIEDGTVYALTAGKTVQVFASTSEHSTSFTVTTVGAQEEEEEMFSIDDVFAWADWYPSDFVPVFGSSAAGGEIFYEYDESVISIDAENCTVTALKEGIVTVRASCGGMQTSFRVRCYAAPDMTAEEYNSSGYDGYISELAARWAEEAADGKTTVFIGDSFFDTRWFWKDFYSTYAGKDALCFGVSSSTSFDWEKFLSEKDLFGDITPKNIAVHIGTNNLYNDRKGVTETVRDLQRLFTMIHGMYPDTPIYYFGISYRIWEEKLIAYTRQINTNMQAWCDERGWIEYLDTPSELTADKLQDDGIHPLAESYPIFVDALTEAGIVLEDK